MSTTPGKGRGSGIPTPGRSGIPAPGRTRSTSSAGHHPVPASPDDEFITKSFQDALKANDPAAHRTYATATHAVHDVSLSPPNSRGSVSSGRRSASDRPSSSASSSSALSSSLSRNATGPKPSMPRPASRASDVFTRSASRAGRSFEIGDNVRLESLGFEGVLQYLGEIDGKPGLFAGVELLEGFAGRGKNDGSFGGKRYFTCPPKCGVFIGADKLSAPTVGVASISRPSSVASVRNGRETPSYGRAPTSASISSSASISTGRKTPSLSNGRVTPVNGRVTPTATGRRTPGIGVPPPRPRTTTMTQHHVTPGRGTTAAAPATPGSGITPGSRASRYLNMTAQQLSSTKPRSNSGTGMTSSPAWNSVSSPTNTRPFGFEPHVISPTHRRTGSPYTPRAGRPGSISNSGTPTKARFATPRARLPSSVAMPPPLSPSASRAISLNDPISRSTRRRSVDLNGHARVDSISGRVSSMTRPESSASNGSSELHIQIERLQARLDSLEDENKRLFMRAEGAENLATELNSRILTLTEERDKTTTRVTELENATRTAERILGERDSMIESLQRAIQQNAIDIEKAKADGETRVRDVQSKLDDKEALVTQLKELIDAKDGEQNENAAALAAKDAEITLLEARVQKAYQELEEERKDLTAQVDELRRAGQETIALYEERLSAADTRRYEMEDLIASLGEQIKAKERPVSPATASRQMSYALEIDNEALREQVQHLIRKASTLEDQLEDARMAQEHEQTEAEEKVARCKEREDAVRAELAESRKEIERVSKGEDSARMRIEEMEEALRENTVALENARAEIEGLRAEIANLEAIAAGATGSPPKTSRPVGQANGAYELLKAEKSALEKACQEREDQLAQEHEANAILRQVLDERVAELEATRKKLNREMTIDSLSESPSTSSISSISSSPSKHELSAAKDEIKGLKHIVNELQMENASLEQKYKVLESENKLLLSETEQLREEMKTLEENIEQSLLREEQAIQEEETAKMSGASEDVVALQKSLRDAKTKYETEIEQLRKRISDLEMKNARTVHDLNKEISELETLIESKIYREDELENELARLKDKLARAQKKSSKGPADESRSSVISTSSARYSIFSDSATSSATAYDVCELCEQPGHDAFNCDMLKEGRMHGSSSRRKAAEELFCEDCEGRGHIAENCPHSLDVF